MEDRILAMCELSNDLLFHKIPRERLGYYVDASLEAGRSAAKCFSGRSIRELYEEYGIAIRHARKRKGQLRRDPARTGSPERNGMCGGGL